MSKSSAANSTTMQRLVSCLVPSSQIQVFTERLTSGRSTTTHDEAQEPLALGLLSARQRRLLEVVHDPPANRLGVRDRLKLEAVLETRDAVGRVDGPARDDEAVVLLTVAVSGALREGSGGARTGT